MGISFGPRSSSCGSGLKLKHWAATSNGWHLIEAERNGMKTGQKFDCQTELKRGQDKAHKNLKQNTAQMENGKPQKRESRCQTTAQKPADALNWNKTTVQTMAMAMWRYRGGPTRQLQGVGVAAGNQT